MKLSVFAAIAATAALVSAAPLRVIVVTSSAQELKPIPLRFGLPAAGANVPHPHHAMVMPVAQPAVHQGRPCGSRFRQKAIEISNAFRKTFGLPLIEDINDGSAFVPVVGHSGSPTFIKPIKPMDGGRGWEGMTRGGDRIHILPAFAPGEEPARPYPGHRHHGAHYRHHHMHGQGESSFFTRIQNAILSLGPWEGRAVAFVLGCGIGVLLRMFWMFGLIMVRSFRGPSEEVHYVQVAVIEDDEDRHATPVSAPPAYIYPVDEKVSVEAPVAKPADK